MTQKVLGTDPPKAHVYFGNRSAPQKWVLAAWHTGGQDNPNPSPTTNFFTTRLFFSQSFFVFFSTKIFKICSKSRLLTIENSRLFNTIYRTKALSSFSYLVPKTTGWIYYRAYSEISLNIVLYFFSRTYNLESSIKLILTPQPLLALDSIKYILAVIVIAALKTYL